MSAHDNLAFTASTVTIDLKKAVSGKGNEKQYGKDVGNGFHVVEIEDKEKCNKNAKELECEYDPYQHREVQHPTTFWETLLHLLKGSVGTGILAMPKAFDNAGWAVGVIGTIIIGLLSTYCIRALIISEYELCKRKKVPSLTYPATMETALEEGPRCLRWFGKYCPHMCNVFLMVYQLGTCCVYTVFIATNLKSGLADYFEISLTTYMLMLMIPLILINWIRNLKLLAPLSTLANIITFISFGIILYYIFSVPLTFEGKRAMGDVENFPLFLGTVLFSLEAIGVIMPLENEMKKPKKFIRPVGVLNIGMFTNIILYVGMGFFGYIRYGKCVDATVTTNLGSKEMLAKTVQVLLALAIFITHSLQCYVAIDISWSEYLQPKLQNLSEKYQMFWEYVLRTVIVIGTVALGIAFPDLELFISLFGALCLAALGISFPALISICAFWKVKTKSGRFFSVAKNGAVICFGILGCVIGTYTSMERIIQEFYQDHPVAAVPLECMAK